MVKQPPQDLSDDPAMKAAQALVGRFGDLPGDPGPWNAWCRGYG